MLVILDFVKEIFDEENAMLTDLRPRVRDMFVGTNGGMYAGRLNGSTVAFDRIGLEGLGIFCATLDVHDPNVVYAGTRRAGLFRSDDRGRTWHEKSNGVTYKEAWSIAQHPTTGTLYLGTGPAAVFISHDRGEHWTFCENIHAIPETIEWTFPRAPHIAHIRGLGVSPTDPEVIFGAIEEGYIIRSKDGGATWTTLKSGIWIDVHTVRVMPDKPNVVIATTGRGVFRSEDGGDNFALCTDVGRRYCFGTVLHPDVPATLFTTGAEVPPPQWPGRAEGANTKFFRSTDQGITWTALSSGLPAVLTAAPRAVGSIPDEPGTFLVGMTDGAIYMTDNFGDSFAQIASGLPTIWSIVVTP